MERWLGLARLQIQTASGSAGAEMVLEGIMEFEAVRDFLYARMRGTKDHHSSAAPGQPQLQTTDSGFSEVIAALASAAEELRLMRAAVEKSARNDS